MIAWARASRGQAAQLTDVATNTLGLARSAADPRAEANAQSLMGGVLQARGKLAEAHAALGECIAVSRRLAEQDPSHVGWQRELAVALHRLGGVSQAQGRLAEAQAAFREDLAISRHCLPPDSEMKMQVRMPDTRPHTYCRSQLVKAQDD